MKYIVAITFIVVLFVGLRIYEIDSKNLWFDEVYSWNISNGSIEQITSETSGDIHPPLYYIVLKYWKALFSDGIFSMRLLSVIFSLMSLFLLYKLLVLLKTERFKIILIMLLYAASPLNIYYSQEVRMLSMNLFLCLGSVFYFYKLLLTDEKSTGLKYFMFTFSAFYAHYFSILIFITEMFTALYVYRNKIINASRLKRFLIFAGLSLISFLPWLPVFLNQTLKGQPWRTEQTLFEAGKNALVFFKDAFLSPYFSFESMTIYYAASVISIFCVVILFYAAIRILNSGSFSSDISNTLLFFVTIPMIIAYVISLNQSIIFSRYLSIIIPYMLSSLVIYSFGAFNRRTAFAVCMVFLFTSIVGDRIYFNNDFKNNDYRKIISFIESNYSKDDHIITEPHFMGWSINYHNLHSNSQLKNPEILGWDMKMQIDSLAKRNDVSKLWFVTDYSSLDKAGYDSLNSNMENLGFRNKISKTFYVIPAKVRVDYFVK